MADEEGDVNLSLLDLLIFEEPKESVFWAPLAAGPVELRARRVGGILLVCFLCSFDFVRFGRVWRMCRGTEFDDDGMWLLGELA